MRRAAALLLLFLLAFPPRALGEAFNWTQAYGGRGEDELTELAAAQGGLLAVGTTSSADGTLAARTRSGETGWALRLGEEGDVLWSLCTGRSGRTRMHGLFAHADGTFSCALSGDADAGSEWLRIDAQGRVTARVPLPDALAVCAHGADGMPQMIAATQAQGRPAMVLRTAHRSGGCCFALLFEDGLVSPGAPVPQASQGALLRTGEGGRVALIEAASGGARVTRTQAGAADGADASFLALGGTPETLTDALVCEDGSVLLAACFARGGALARVSAGGDALFCVPVEDAPLGLSLTRSGFAAATARALLFFSEEGALLGERPVPPGAEDAALRDMAAWGDGVALLGFTASTALRQAHIAAAGGFTVDAGDAFATALYARMDSRVLAADAEQGDIRLLVADEDGQHTLLRISPEGRILEETAAGGDAPALGDLLRRGLVRAERASGGALISRLDASGGALWRTRVPIQTAADRLSFSFAREADGDLLLGGCCETGEGDGAMRQAALVLLGREGELRAVRTFGEPEAFLAALPQGEALLLLCAQRGETFAAAMSQDGARLEPLGALEFPLEAEGAALLALDGRLYAAGTALRAGRMCALVQEIR